MHKEYICLDKRTGIHIIGLEEYGEMPEVISTAEDIANCVLQKSMKRVFL
jgi:hypothetical protein